MQMVPWTVLAARLLNAVFPLLTSRWNWHIFCFVFLHCNISFCRRCQLGDLFNWSRKPQYTVCWTISMMSVPSLPPSLSPEEGTLSFCPLKDRESLETPVFHTNCCSLKLCYAVLESKINKLLNTKLFEVKWTHRETKRSLFILCTRSDGSFTTWKWLVTFDAMFHGSKFIQMVLNNYQRLFFCRGSYFSLIRTMCSFTCRVE